MIEIPREKLSDDALIGVIDEFILREGTDYGSVELSLDAKRDRLLKQLDRGEVKIVFETESQSVTLVKTDQTGPLRC